MQDGSASCRVWMWGKPFHSLPQRRMRALGLHSLPLKLDHLLSFKTDDTQYFCALISILSCSGCKAGVKVLRASCARTVLSSRAPCTDTQSQIKAELCLYTGVIVDSVLQAPSSLSENLCCSLQHTGQRKMFAANRTNSTWTRGSNQNVQKARNVRRKCKLLRDT